MEIEKQVCSLEQAKRLSELGIEASSVFRWSRFNSEEPFELSNNGGAIEFYSAYTVAELGEMLPVGHHTFRDELTGKPYFGCYHWDGSQREPQSMRELVNAGSHSEAQARAAMLIHLLETKTIKP